MLYTLGDTRLCGMWFRSQGTSREKNLQFRSTQVDFLQKNGTCLAYFSDCAQQREEKLLSKKQNFTIIEFLELNQLCSQRIHFLRQRDSSLLRLFST